MSDINVSAVSSAYTGYSAKTETKEVASAEKNKQESSDVGVVYEKSEEKGKAPYTINKMSEKDRAALISQMKQDVENRKSQMASLVQQMFSKQSGVMKLSELFSPENLKNVSAADIAQAKEDISEDGYWGVKQTSQRLFDFASALAGDDVNKMKEMQAAMEKGFKKAEEMWGGKLPDICNETINAANKLFDDYYASHGAV